MPQRPSRQRLSSNAYGSRNPLGRIVAVPSLWQRPGGVLQENEMGVIRPSEANTFVNTGRIMGSNLPHAGFWPR